MYHKNGDAAATIESEEDTLTDIMDRESRCEVMDSDVNLIQDYLKSHAIQG